MIYFIYIILCLIVHMGVKGDLGLILLLQIKVQRSKVSRGLLIPVVFWWIFHVFIFLEWTCNRHHFLFTLSCSAVWWRSDAQKHNILANIRTVLIKTCRSLFLCLWCIFTDVVTAEKYCWWWLFLLLSVLAFVIHAYNKIPAAPGRKQWIHKSGDCYSKHLSSLPNLTYYMTLMTPGQATHSKCNVSNRWISQSF